MTQPLEDPIAAKDADFETLLLPAEDAVNLRVLGWQPRRPRPGAPIVFVAGWVSSVLGWADLLRALVAKHPVYYIETREKASAEIAKNRRLAPSDLSIEQMADDLIEVSRSLPVPIDQAVLVGSSLGATVILEALKGGRLSARAAFLIGPNSDFSVSRLLHPVLYLPAFLYPLVKYFVLWYLRTFRVDRKREPEQWARYDATLRAAHPKRLKLSARAAIRYTVWDNIASVGIPVTVACASSDTLHDSDKISRLVKAIPQANLVDCPSNKHMHSAALMAELEPTIRRA